MTSSTPLPDWPQVIISGGQTGADQGGLMAAWERGYRTGGLAPISYRTSRGPNPLLEVLGLEETIAHNYQTRTRLNVELADVTLIFAFDLQSPGSRLTAQVAQQLGRPHFNFHLSRNTNGAWLYHAQMETAIKFLMRHRPEVINVAGNRDKDYDMEVFEATRSAFGHLLDLLKDAQAKQSV